MFLKELYILINVIQFPIKYFYLFNFFQLIIKNFLYPDNHEWYKSGSSYGVFHLSDVVEPTEGYEIVTKEFVQEYFKKFFDSIGFTNYKLRIGEGGFIDPYDEGGLENSLKGEEEHIAYRRLTLHQTRNKQNISFNIVNDRIKEWVFSISANRPAESLGQKCGMDKEDTIAIDMKGNVTTCQNTSSLTKHNLQW